LLEELASSDDQLMEGVLIHELVVVTSVRDYCSLDLCRLFW